MSFQETEIDLSRFRVRYSPQISNEFAELIFEFFIVFSRFEYTLKHTGYLIIDDKNRVFPDWVTFCNKFGDQFQINNNELLTDAVIYYLTKPTKIEIFEEGQFKWGNNIRGNGESDFAWLLRSIRYTRNNLFHGGKFPIKPVRDPKLLYFGIVILYECLELNDELLRVFNAPF